MRADHGLDLARLDAEATNLDLLIGAPDNLDDAVGAIARQIAGAVEPLAACRAERIRRRSSSPSAPAG